MPIDAEVLIVSYNSANFLRRCLPTIAAAMPEVPVAIREHGSDPVALAAIEHVAAAHTAPVRLEYDASNPGFGAGCNALAAGSRADWLVFLNPDTEVIAWIEGSPPDRSIVGATMVDSGPPGDHSGRSYRFVDEVARSWLRRRGAVPDWARLRQRSGADDPAPVLRGTWRLRCEVLPLLRRHRPVHEGQCCGNPHRRVTRMEGAARPPPQHRRPLPTRSHGPTSRAAASIASTGRRSPCTGRTSLWTRLLVALCIVSVATELRSSAYSALALAGARPRSSFCARASPVPRRRIVIALTGPLRSCQMDRIGGRPASFELPCVHD